MIVNFCRQNNTIVLFLTRPNGSLTTIITNITISIVTRRALRATIIVTRVMTLE